MKYFVKRVLDTVCGQEGYGWSVWSRGFLMKCAVKRVLDGVLGKYHNCHLVLEVFFWVFLVLSLVL